MESQKKYKIILVDDQPIFREGLKLYLENELGHNIIAEASNGKEFLELTNIYDSDIVLMDIEMPEINGLKASKKILERFSNIKIVAITVYQDKAYLKTLVENGIRGFVRKSDTFDNIENTLSLVYNNEFCFPDNLKVVEE